MDPGRWSNDDMTPLEHQLLDAARSEQMPEALSAKMAAALQAGGTATTATAAGASAAKLATPLFTKVGLWGALSLGLMATASWYAARPAPASPSASPASTPPELAPPAAAAQHDEPTPATRPPGTQPDHGAGGPTADGAKPLHDTAGPAAEAATPTVQDGALRAEVALLGRSRAALRERAPDRALRLLDRHTRRFPHGTLAPEAAALRIEALIQQGNDQQAEAETDRFVAVYPAHPLRARVTELTRARAAAAPR